MGGRLFKGEWNTALFDTESGKRLHTENTEMRTSAVEFSADGTTLYLAGGKGQGKNPWEAKEWGRILLYSVTG